MLKEALTLDETWDKCLEMWQWIAEVTLSNPFSTVSVETLKSTWMKENFGRKSPEANCFFCDYDYRRNFNCHCPGHLIDEEFDCDCDAYCYYLKPVEFYNKISQLNFIRTGKM
jgi:hypothetical protein